MSIPYKLPRYHTRLPAVPVRWVLIQDPNGKFEPPLLCTDLSAPPSQILHCFRQHWQLEVTFEEVRAHLGVEAQRQWSELAILRTTPALLALFSLVALLAHCLQGQSPFVRPNSSLVSEVIPNVH